MNGHRGHIELTHRLLNFIQATREEQAAISRVLKLVSIPTKGEPLDMPHPPPSMTNPDALAMVVAGIPRDVGNDGWQKITDFSALDSSDDETPPSRSPPSLSTPNTSRGHTARKSELFAFLRPDSDSDSDSDLETPMPVEKKIGAEEHFKKGT